MKFIHLSFLIIILLSVLSFAQNNKDNRKKIGVIPEPTSVEIGYDAFKFNERTEILVASQDPKVKDIAEYFAEQLRIVGGFPLRVNEISENREINNAVLFTDKNTDSFLSEEGYSLKCDQNGIIISGTPRGLFYGVQTLFQLLPPYVYGDKPVANIDWSVPAVTIKDKPRFEWRGMHLDVGRHIFPVSFIKRYIDFLAIHKLNTFHWHLTEDQGWRIEIKKYPKLTEIGAWRKGTQIGKTAEIDSVRYGGFYTQEEAREVVEYAAEKFITVVPEIELPGHSIAALASYPNLSCTGGPFEVATHWGVDADIYCAGNDSVFTFLEDVLTEVMDIFPSKYIHIGGDEAPKTRWEECPKCQARIKNENLKDEHELQSYFIRRIEKFLNEHGRQIIGWDEILEGGLAPNADVMSWRGIAGGIEAAKQKHNVVMTPTSFCYFDYYQGPPEGEPLAIGGFLPLEKVYSYEPVPEELNEEEREYIIGVQGNVWTEYIATPEHAEYMALPRMCALAEVAWSPAEKRDTKNFLDRMNKHYERLDAMNVNYRWPALTGFDYENVFIDKATLQIIPGQKNTIVRYTTDGTEPTKRSKIYTEPITVSENVLFKFREFKPNGKSGKVYSVKYEKQIPLDPAKENKGEKGLKFELFELEDIISSLDEMKNLSPIKKGAVENFVFPYPDESLPQRFGVKYSGYIEIPEEDVYTFSVISDDGTRLFIDKRLVVDNDGQHGSVKKSGQIALKEGLHKIELSYFQVGGAKTLQVLIQQNGEDEKEISGKLLWR